jgi:hypothetical protein
MSSSSGGGGGRERGSLRSSLHDVQLDSFSNSTIQRSCEEYDSSLRSLCRSHSVGESVRGRASIIGGQERRRGREAGGGP